MSVEVELPTGDIATFPDGMSREAMRSVLMQRFGAQTVEAGTRNAHAGGYTEGLPDLRGSAPQDALHGAVAGINSSLELVHESADWLRKRGIGPNGHLRMNLSGKGPMLSSEKDNVPETHRMRLPNVDAPATGAGNVVATASRFLTGSATGGRALSGAATAGYDISDSAYEQ